MIFFHACHLLTDTQGRIYQCSKQDSNPRSQWAPLVHTQKRDHSIEVSNSAIQGVPYNVCQTLGCNYVSHFE
jgi:hypothetical protein